MLLIEALLVCLKPIMIIVPIDLFFVIFANIAQYDGFIRVMPVNVQYPIVLETACEDEYVCVELLAQNGPDYYVQLKLVVLSEKRQLIMSLSVTTAFAMVYEPNTDIPTEEITSDSKPMTLAARANAEGQWQHNSTGWWWVLYALSNFLIMIFLMVSEVLRAYFISGG